MINITNLGLHLTATQKKHIAKMFEMNMTEAKCNTIYYNFAEVSAGMYEGFYIQNRYSESKGKCVPERTRIKFSVRITA